MTLELAHQALLALGFLHRKNVVHRDVAPDNLMLTYDDEGRPQLKLIDLGIAKPLDNTINLTSTGVFLGKLKYSSPEQLGGLTPGETLDARSDLYSLGVVLYELLTGRLPFPGDSPKELLAAHLFKEPIPFSVTDPNNRVPEPVRALVLRAMDKERGRRFASAEELDREIRALQENLAPFYDPDATHRLLAKVRESKGAPKDNVTPSAQDRLDRHFLAQGTPTPLSRTGAPPAEVTGEWEETVATPIGGTVRPRRIPAAALVLAGAAAVIVAVLALTRGKPEARPPAEPAPEATVPTPPVVAAVVPPTALPVEVPSPAPPTESPREEPTAPAAPAAVAPDNTARLRRAADDARLRSRSARGAAERARAPELAASLYESGRKKEREGARLSGDGRYDAAAASFENATALFRQAESWSRTALTRQPERVAAIPPVREPTVAAAPPPAKPAAAVVPTAVPEEPKPAPVKPAETAARVRSEEDRVRDAVALYVQAQNSLDVALYARVYPSLAGARRRMVEEAFGNLKSQTLELEIRKVSVDGSHATVSGFERRLAVPRVGGEQRDARERDIRLEKRGDGWVITELR